jgi:hypothetical protein
MNDLFNRQHSWVDEIPDEQWQVYHHVIQSARSEGLNYAIGGAFGVAAYTGRWRNTKDLDFYVLPEDRAKMIDVVSSTGMRDYYDTESYDRGWIYRAHRGDVIVDVIWAMANARVEVDNHWLSTRVQVPVRGINLPVLPVEELIWAKLYVLQSDRCDWPDVLNLVHASAVEIDWDHLIARLDEDLPILGSLMALFGWLDPERASQLPESLWERLGLHLPSKDSSPDVVERRAQRLDSRPWFHPLL